MTLLGTGRARVRARTKTAYGRFLQLVRKHFPVARVVTIGVTTQHRMVEVSRVDLVEFCKLFESNLAIMAIAEKYHVEIMLKRTSLRNDSRAVVFIRPCWSRDLAEGEPPHE